MDGIDPHCPVHLNPQRVQDVDVFSCLGKAIMLRGEGGDRFVLERSTKSMAAKDMFLHFHSLHGPNY